MLDGNPKATPWIRLNTQAVVLAVAALLWAFLAIKTSNIGRGDEELYSRFLNLDNIQNIMKQMAIQGVIGIGAVLVILTAGIDLSIGSLIAVVNVCMAMLLKNAGLPMMAVIPLVLGLSMLVGLGNGVLVHDLKLPPFIATLGMMSILRGAALLISGGRTISGLPTALKDFATARFLYLPALFWVLIGVVVVVEAVLRKTTFGRYVYAIGSNREAARLSGVNVRFVTYGVYTLASLLGGIAGCMQTARDWQGSPTTGATFELDAIAAAVIGGTLLSGGVGYLAGTLMGVLIFGLIQTLITNKGTLSSWWTSIAIGTLVLVFILLQNIVVALSRKSAKQA